MSTSLQHALEFAALKAFAIPVRLLPRSWALAWGQWAGRLGWWFGPRRGLVLSNLQQALPESTAEQRRDIGRRAAGNFGKTVAEFLRFAGRDRLRVSELVHIEGLDALRRRLEDGQGAIVVTPHLGAWALYVTAMAAAGIPSALLVGKQSNPHVDRLILGIPGDAVRFISKGKQAPRRILENLSEGRVVVMVADHYVSSEAVWAPFLGRNASTLPLPGALVAKRQTPLFLMRGVRQPDQRHQLLVRPLTVPSDLSGDDLRLAVAELCNRELGREVLQHPEQYWWYHDRFKVRGGFRDKKKVLGTPPFDD